MDNRDRGGEFGRGEDGMHHGGMPRDDMEMIYMTRRARRRAERARMYAERRRVRRRRERISLFGIVAAFVVLGIALVVCAVLIIKNA